MTAESTMDTVPPPGEFLAALGGERPDDWSVARRFRGFMPVVVDVETGGLNPETDALLELAAVLLDVNAQGKIVPVDRIQIHVAPFEGANLDPISMKINGIDVDHPFRNAVPEAEALQQFFQPIRQRVKLYGARRAILVGHNAAFDLAVINAAVARTGNKRNPFHPFSTFDTVTLSALAVGETVLAKALEAIGLEWDSAQAHGALYDAEQTAELFCRIMNAFSKPNGRAPLRVPPTKKNDAPEDEPE
ncbi:ribonuclease T [Halothiobacillus diazotrophicus]|uniref:Ribonuclease T n=2 Tax=Halothiobacillus diazotrophicus TaxID=1860122 RepID=A0A191ZIZ8_9GAMM|nr:ribonuclease T [Halothiobacillus diazotrophicus]